MTNKLSRWAPLTGVLYVGLMVGLLSGPSSPDSKATGTEVIAWYQQHSTLPKVQVFLLAYAALSGLVFFGVLSARLFRRGAQGLAALAFAGAVLLVSGLCGAAALTMTLTDNPGRLTPDAAQALSRLSNDGFAIVLFTGLAVAMTATGAAVLRTRELPRWLGWASVVIGVAAATGVLSWFAFMASGLWILTVAGLLVRRPADEPTVITLPDVPAARADSDSRTHARMRTPAR